VTDDTGFERYRVLMFARRKPKTFRWLWGIPGFGFSSYPAFRTISIEGFDSDVRVGRPKWFEGDMLRTGFGARWPEVLAKELAPDRRAFLRIDGEDASGTRYRLPRAAVPEATEAPATRRGGRRAGSGLSVLVRHLTDVDDVTDYRVILEALEESGLEWVRRALDAGGSAPVDRVAIVKKAHDNGKRFHDSRCPYCSDGLPTAIGAALRTS